MWALSALICRSLPVWKYFLSLYFKYLPGFFILVLISVVLMTYTSNFPLVCGKNFFKCSFFEILFIYFLERGEGKEKERKRNINVWLPLTRPPLGIWLATQACVLTGNRTINPLAHRPAFNPLSHTSQG